MINPEKKSIEDILSSSRITLTVPHYQRSFEWGKEELQEFIDDLYSVSKDNNKNLFLGNFIFDTSKGDMIQIVDGQQRLTTISLAFIVLRDIAGELNDIDLKNEAQRYISNYSRVRQVNEVKFKTSKNIQKIYEYIAHPNWDGDFPNTIDNESVRKQRNKIKPIYDYIKNEFKKSNPEEINNLIKSLLDTYVVVINVDNKEDMFSIFERTNARGLDLNIGDLVKNYIFSYQHEGFEDKWNAIVDNASGSLAKMLKYNWVSQKGHIMQSKLYRNLKKDINKDTDGINKYMKGLYEFSEYYNMFNSADEASVQGWLEHFSLDTLQGNQDYISRITRVIQALKLFRVTQVIPLIYSIFQNFKHQQQKDKEYLFRILHTIERYHFINNVVCGRVANEVEKFYAEKAKEFYSSENSLKKEANFFINELISKKASKEEFMSQFIENINYSDNTKNKVLINYVFDRINNIDTKKKKPVPGSQYVEIFKLDEKLNKRNYNIEHLLNQKYRDEDNPEFDSSIIDQIGNLLVISRHTNSALPHIVKEKIELLKSDEKYIGNLRYLKDFINKYNEEFPKWNKSSIEKRSKDLAELSYEKVWYF